MNNINKSLENEITKLVHDGVKKVLSTKLTAGNIKESIKETAKTILKEAVILAPKVFSLRTEYQSKTTKENHFKLYKAYVDSFNLISSKLDSIDKQTEPLNPNNSDYRRLKIDEQNNLNGVKLHELYFSNISDLSSEIRTDSIAFQRLQRDWGSFENWQFDFRACGFSATEGWAILYYEPMKQRYLNTFIEKHSENIPVCGIPVLVIDTWHHAWFRDYPGDKMNYLNAMMREINWSVCEARMAVAESCNLNQLFMIQPIMNTETQKLLAIQPTNKAPIEKNQIVDKIEIG